MRAENGELNPPRVAKASMSLADRVALLEQEIATLTDLAFALRRSHRADLDEMKLEIETLKLFLSARHDDFWSAYSELRHQVNREVAPE